MASDVVPATDRGLAYGDGVFRTLAVHAGIPVLWSQQYAKLASDSARLGIFCPSSEELRHDVLAVTANDTNAAVKIIITRGNGERGYRMPQASRPNRVVLASPLSVYPDRYISEGIAVHLCRTRLGTQPALAGVKHLNRLENILGRAEWEGDAYAEGIFLDVNGNVIGGTMTNVFIVERGRLATPGLEHCGVAGVTRQLILDCAAANNVEYGVETIPLDRLMTADETFVVNTLIGAWAVHSIGDRTMRTGAMIHRIRAWLDECRTLD